MHDGTSYQLIPSTPNCHAEEGNSCIGNIETMTLNANQLHIEHFAVDSSLIGKGRAELLLREFAALVRAQAPNITTMTFDLGRSTPTSDIAKLAQARVALFQRVGALNIQQRKPNPDSIVVSATWDRSKW